MRENEASENVVRAVISKQACPGKKETHVTHGEQRPVEEKEDAEEEEEDAYGGETGAYL